MTLPGNAMVAGGLKLVGWKKAGLRCKQVGAILETADFVDVTNHEQPGVPIVYCHEKAHASGGKIRVLYSVDAVQVHIIKSNGESEYCKQS
ncbi:hypothetical protein AAVH_23133 [Aphelenchoides avenae]|nr:hypothetical protein AAVH_23133 [Aphelenchus avenae]